MLYNNIIKEHYITEEHSTIGDVLFIHLSCFFIYGILFLSKFYCFALCECDIDDIVRRQRL
jgi:hypothetical protein